MQVVSQAYACIEHTWCPLKILQTRSWEETGLGCFIFSKICTFTTHFPDKRKADLFYLVNLFIWKMNTGEK